MTPQSIISGIAEQARSVASALDGVVRQTPLTFSAPLSQMSGARVYLKQENLQLTGSCKARSAMTNLIRLPAERRARGVVTASTGNNGIATAWAANELGLENTVYLPRTTSRFKVDKIREAGGRIVFHGDDIVHAELAARSYAAESGAYYVSPYNGLGAVHGQATIAMEMLAQLDAIGEVPDTVLVPIGGGGLISGIAGYLASIGAPTRVIGVQPALSPVMTLSIDAGRIVDLPYQQTLSDATAGGLEPNTITFDLCQTLIDTYTLIDEDALAQAMVLAYDEHDVVLEGSGALSIAGLFGHSEELTGQTVVLLLCGANIDRHAFEQLRFAATA